MSKRVPQTLIAKLAAACDAVGGIDKKGENKDQSGKLRYKYLKAADVAKAVRHELSKRGVILTADEKEFSHTGSIATQSGAELREFTLKVEYTLRDADSGDTITTTAYGVAMDSGDKALWKAKTGALKYFLRGLFILPDEKDDPEADTLVDDKAEEAYKKDFEKKTKNQTRLEAWQISAFDNACHHHGRTAEQVAQYLKARFSVATIADLTKPNYQDAMKFARNDLKETLKVVEKKSAERVMVSDPEQTSQAGD